MIKVASRQELPVASRIMQQIHDEDPSFWPHGLSADQFNGGLYLMQKTANEEPVGFVGWQKFDEGGRKVGYYAVGVLPEHRQQSFAKQAVAQVIREIGPQCDEVKALVMAHNEPSKALARSLRVPMLEKLAATSPKAQALSALVSGLGTAAFFDQTANPDRSVGSTFQPWKWDKERGLMGALNVLLGGVGGQQLSKGNVGTGLASIAMAPTKDLAIKGVGSLYKIDDAAEEAAKSFVADREATDAAPSGGKENWAESIPKGVWAGAGGLGLGALGLLAYNAKKKRDLKERELEQSSHGRVKITLPTKQKGDTETQVELPFGDFGFSQALRGRLKRDTKRRLHEETKARTKHRQPKNPDKPTKAEQELIDLKKEREELDKAASLPMKIQFLVDEVNLQKQAVANNMNAPGNVPMPPQLGQNPAMRMQHEEATAKSIQPSTDANPQILEARQAAMQAEAQGQQQMAEAEQAAQAAQMEQQQAFQQQMMKSEQEKEVLKLQLEKEKALKDLSAAQAKGQADAASAAGKGEGTAVQRMAQNRIGRLQKRVMGKSAATRSGTAYGVNRRVIGGHQIPEGLETATDLGVPTVGAQPNYPPSTATFPALAGVPSSGGASKRPPGFQGGGKPYPSTAPWSPVAAGTPGTLSPSTGQPINEGPIHLTSRAVQNINRSPEAHGNLFPRIGIYRHSYGKLLDGLFDMFGKKRLYTPDAPDAGQFMSQEDMINTPDKMGMIAQVANQGRGLLGRFG